VDDLADALLFLMYHYDDGEIINIGTGLDLSIRELAERIGKIAGFKGALQFNTGRPDGTRRKLLDVSRINALGWDHRIGLNAGITETLAGYAAHARSHQG
jgi:GDP-L-fucose synthase